MPYEASRAYYQELVRQQDEVLASGTDIEAFLYGLRQFPSLRTVTVTPIKVHVDTLTAWIKTVLVEMSRATQREEKACITAYSAKRGNSDDTFRIIRCY